MTTITIRQGSDLATYPLLACYEPGLRESFGALAPIGRTRNRFRSAQTVSCPAGSISTPFHFEETSWCTAICNHAQGPFQQLCPAIRHGLTCRSMTFIIKLSN